MKQVQQAAEAVLQQLETVIFGKRAVLELVLACLLAEGHLLLEERARHGQNASRPRPWPGLSAAAFAACSARRTCCPATSRAPASSINGRGSSSSAPGGLHPDPAGGRGQPRHSPRPGRPARMHGRAPGERGQQHLPAQAPVLSSSPPRIRWSTRGPSPLPEAQLDRFLMRLSIGYPGLRAEEKMLEQGERSDPLTGSGAGVEPRRPGEAPGGDPRGARPPEVRRYIVQVTAATRGLEGAGAGRRAGAPRRGSTASARPAPPSPVAASCCPTTSSASIPRSSTTG